MGGAFREGPLLKGALGGQREGMAHSGWFEARGRLCIIAAGMTYWGLPCITLAKARRGSPPYCHCHPDIEMPASLPCARQTGGMCVCAAVTTQALSGPPSHF